MVVVIVIGGQQKPQETLSMVEYTLLREPCPYIVFDIMMTVPQLLHSCNQLYVAGGQTHQAFNVYFIELHNCECWLKAFFICQYIMLI